MAETTKTQIPVAEFEKKVEIELSHLVYFDRLPKHVAANQARNEISKRFEAVE